MNIEMKKIISGLILIIGLVLFLWTISAGNIYLAMVVLTGTLILWLMYALLMGYFDIKTFSWIISSAGMLLALVVFILYGVEELSYPIGAFAFHSRGIAGALGISFFASLPIIFLYQSSKTHENKTLKVESPESVDGPTAPIIESDDWEIANDEDFESGEWEIA